MTERRLAIPARYMSWARGLASAQQTLPKALPTIASGPGLRYLGLVLLALATGASSLTFNWVIHHNPEANLFPEFAGRVLYLSDILMFAGLVLWATGWLLAPPRNVRYGPPYVFLPLLLLTTLTAASILWAADDALAGVAATRRVLLLGLYVALVNEASRALTPTAVALLGIGLLHSGVALAQMAGGSATGLTLLGEIPQNSLGHEIVGVSRAYGLGFNPNPVGLFLAAVSLLAYGLFLLKEGGWRFRAVLLAACLTTFFGLAATSSRSALMGWFLGSLVVTVLGWFWGKVDLPTLLKRGGSAGLVVLFPAIIYVLALSAEGDTPTLGRITRVFDRFNSSQITGGLGTRAGDLAMSFPIIQEHFLLGVGAGNYPTALHQRLDPDVPGGIYTPPHNVPLTVLAELGIAGLVAWLIIMAAPLIWVFQNRKSGPGGLHSLVWLGPLVVLIFEGLWDFPPWATQDGRLLMMAVLALWAGGARSGRASTEKTP